ncbi:hypothetical protein F4803DRAFT_495989, partial [Xylaria telfairii]
MIKSLFSSTPLHLAKFQLVPCLHFAMLPFVYTILPSHYKSPRRIGYRDTVTFQVTRLEAIGCYYLEDDRSSHRNFPIIMLPKCDAGTHITCRRI